MPPTPSQQAFPDIILASTSPYRARLLDQIGLKYTSDAPDFEEKTSDALLPEVMARQFAEGKARSLTNKYPNSLIIGSDQTASLNNQILTKPGSMEAACGQLAACSGKEVVFYSGLAVLNTQSNRIQLAVDSTTVKFRPLTATQIENYVTTEQPLDCCGSFKVEGLGIALFESVSSKDPYSLIGLPLINLISMLKEEGLSIP